MSDWYRLDENKRLVPVSLMEVGDVWERVDETWVERVRISTVFMGLDHSWDGGPPLVFETMVFGGVLDGEQERCSTWEQAEAQHERLVRKVRVAEVQANRDRDRAVIGAAFRLAVWPFYAVRDWWDSRRAA